jgi:hypothetical protein
MTNVQNHPGGTVAFGSVRVAQVQDVALAG